MFNLRELLDLFTGRTSMESFAGNRISVTSGATTYAMIFGVIAFLFLVEALVFRLGFFFMGANEGFVAFLIAVGLIIVASLVIIPIALIAELAFIYVWGAFHYALARFYSNKPGLMNDFNGSLMALFSSLKLAQGLVFLVPVIGWLAAGVMQLYGLLLTFRFMKEKFNLSDAQAAIVVLIPFNLALGVLLLAALTASFALIGTRFF